MKRVSGLIEKIFDFGNLVVAAHKAFKGKSGSKEVNEFRRTFCKSINRLRFEIVNDRLKFGNYKRFIIYEPKKRVICAAPLEQRIIHHAIMNVCHRFFDRNLIYDCYASRPDKGVHKAIFRTQEFSRSYKYYVKLDIRKYFDSIDHQILIKRLNSIFKDKQLLYLFYKIIESYNVEDDKGLPIGNLTSQYFANFYLSGLDHYMKESLKCKAYIRYMDDVIIMSNTREEIKLFTYRYCNYASSQLFLTVKPPLIGRLCDGVTFLGYKIYRERILLGGKAKRRFRREIDTLGKLYCKDIIQESEYSSKLISVLSYAKFADSYKFRKKWLNVSEL